MGAFGFGTGRVVIIFSKLKRSCNLVCWYCLDVFSVAVFCIKTELMVLLLQVHWIVRPASMHSPMISLALGW